MNVKDLKNEEQANGLSNNLENDIQDKIINLQQKIQHQNSGKKKLRESQIISPIPKRN